MKTKVALGKKTLARPSAIMIAAVAGVIGLGGLTLVGDSVSAVANEQVAVSSSSSSRTTTSTTRPSTSSSSSSSSSSNNKSTTTTTTTPAATETTTPNTGLFTADGDFASTEGALLLMGILAAGALGGVVLHNRKQIFHRVDFNKR